MNKLFIALTAGAFALGSIDAMAQTPQGDKTPAAPVDQAKMKAEKDAAKAAAAKMTPEEKAAAKKAKRGKKQKEMSKIEQEGNPATGTTDAAAMKKNYDATKNDPKALETKADKQKALKEQEKKSSGQ
jgi:hypothetical protein